MISDRHLIANGIVSHGLGRGSQFLGLDWVQRELRDKIGLTPFPGTLNLQVPTDARSALYERRDSFVKIADPSSASCAGFLKPVLLRANERVFPSAYLILPEITIYTDVVEIVAEVNLREKLQLKDGDRVRVEEFSESDTDLQP